MRTTWTVVVYEVDRADWVVIIEREERKGNSPRIRGLGEKGFEGLDAVAWLVAPELIVDPACNEVGMTEMIMQVINPQGHDAASSGCLAGLQPNSLRVSRAPLLCASAARAC